MTFFTSYYRSLFLALALLLGSATAYATLAIGEVVPASAGQCDGSIEVWANGSAGAFHIEITGPGEFSDFVEGIGDPEDPTSPSSYTFTGLCGGSYNIFVTNRFGCTTTLSTNLSCTLVISAEVTPSCTPGGGAISITPEGGTAPYYYKWRNVDGTFGSLLQNLTDLAPDEYTLNIADANGCSASEIFSTIPDDEYPYIKKVKAYAVINDMEILIYQAEWKELPGNGCIKYSGGTLTITQQTFDEIANEAAELKLVVEANKPLLSLLVEIPQSLGSLPDAKNIENNGEIWNIWYSSQVTSSMISEGNIYFPLIFTGYDEKNRFLLDLMTLSNGLTQCVPLPTLNENCQWTPQPLVRKDDVHIIGNTCISFDFSIKVENIDYDCQTGLANACVKIVDGGSSSYSFIWENTEQGNCISGLTPGGCYNVIVTDICGLSKVKCIEVPILMPLTIENYKITPNCSENEGEIKLEVEGGKRPYSYTWNGPENFYTVTSESQIGNLIPGDYTVTVTDQCLNQVITSFVIEEIVNNNITVSVNQDIPACTENGLGSLIDISAHGVVAPQFQWSNGNTDEDLQNVPAGNYTVTITDANGCFKTHTVIVKSNEHYPFRIDFATVSRYPCTNEETGDLFVRLSSYSTDNPFPPYIFEWSNGVVHESTGSLLESRVNDIPTGNYSVTITDSRGCERIENISLQPAIFDLEFLVTNCDPKLAITTKSNENNGPRYFRWDDGPTIDWGNDNNANILFNPSLGTHCVTVTDWEGCQEESCYYFESPMIEIILDDIRHPTYYSDEDIEVNDGFIKISVQGGTPPYTYLWNNAETTEDVFDLSSNYYEVTVTDANGCSSTQSFNIINCPPVSNFKLEIGPRNVIPCTTGNGSIRPHVSGGTLPYTFSWTGPNGFISNSKDIDGLTMEGNYCVTITDYCGNIRTNCQYLTCNCPTVDFSYNVNDRCLRVFADGRSGVEFEGFPYYAYPHDIIWAYGNNIFNGTVQDDGGFKFAIDWSTGQTGSYVVDYSNDNIYGFSGTKITIPNNQPGDDKLIESIVTDFLGCQHAEYHYFKKEERGGILIAEPLDNYIPADSGFEAYTKSKGCDICGGECVANSSEPEFLQYDPLNKRNPCKGGGIIFSHKGEYFVPENTQAIEFVDYTRGVNIGNGECQYPCGCLFPWGTIEDIDKPVYIINTVKIETGNCSPDDPPTITNCEGHIEFKYVGDCNYRKFCNLTGEFIDDTLYPGGGTFCSKKNEDGSCKIISECNLDGCVKEVLIDNIDCEEAILLFSALRANCSSCVYSPSDELFFMGNSTNTIDSDISTNMNSLTMRDIQKIFHNEGWSKALLITKVYPNPFKEIFYLEIENQEAEFLEINLFSTTGKHILNKNSYVTKGKNVIFIDVDKSLPSGVYYLKVNDQDGNIHTHKIVH